MIEDKFIFKPVPRAPVSDPQLSPDGQRILFTHTTINEEDDKYERHIWIVPTSGGKPRQFTYSKANDSNPRWSPDGKYILFLSNRGKTQKDMKEKKIDFWIIPSDGGEARLLTSVPGSIVGAPLWSPSGKKFLFLNRAKVEEEGKKNTSDVRVIKKLNRKLNGVGFFPDTRIHLFIVNIEDGEFKQLTKGEFDVASPDWSPDAEMVAFIANMKEDTDYSVKKDVWKIPSSGGKLEKVVEGVAVRVISLAWSPDGKYLAYTSIDPYDPDNPRFKFSNLWVVPSQGGEPVNLTKTYDRPIGGRLVWGPDSKVIYFAAPDYGTVHLYKLELDSMKIENVTGGSMTVQSFSLNRDGSTIAYTATEPTRLPEIWVHNDEGDRCLTEICGDFVKDMILIKPEEFRFKASDGPEIQGWIMKPVGYKEGERYPTILSIHGGPWSNYGYSFYHRFQTLCNSGFSVVFVNPRASTGYGESFADITGHYGEREYLDLMEAIDFVVKSYHFVDGDRLGVTGGSYGGFMTNWIIGHTDRFKAAVTAATISNWISKYGCSDIGYRQPEFVAGDKEYWGKHIEEHWEKSPLRYVNNVKTPLLILHGEK